MSELQIYLLRHGETPWSLSGQHTSFSDIKLTPHGQAQAKQLGAAIKEISFSKVFSSSTNRAKQTCLLAGIPPQEIAVWPDVVEWNYGKYEGRTTPDIRKEVSDWSIFTHGAPGGESVEQVGQRADRVIAQLLTMQGNIAIFSSGHFSRVLGARWINAPVLFGRHLALSTASLSILGFERDIRTISRWNDTSHLK